MRRIGDDQHGQPQGAAPAFLMQELEDLHPKGLYRRLRTLSDFQGAHARWQGRELLLFCGNDYLGLSHDPRVMEAACEALKRFGVGAGAARLISGTSDLHTQLEEELARFKGKERALLFGSGYLANLGILSALAQEKDLIVMDKLCHASLIDGARLSGAILRVFPHKNYAKCEEILKQGKDARRRVIVSETVFSMEGDLADLNELVRLKERYEAELIIDDAHGTGVFGPEGRGAVDLETGPRIDVIMGTLSKALGVFGGFAAASGPLIEHLINFSRPFIFATAPPPVLAAAALEALRLIREEPALRERLWKNVDEVRRFLKGKGFALETPSPIFPLILGEEKEALRVSEELLKRGLLIPAIRYPTVPKGKARLRLTVSAAHTGTDLEKLFVVLNEVLG